VNGHLSKLARWIVFTVLIALVPLVVAALRVLTHSEPFTLVNVLKHGELLLISTAVGGSAIGELIGSGTLQSSVRKTLCGGATLVLIMISGMWFADIASSPIGTLNLGVVSSGSLAIFIFTVLSGGSCVALSEV
jgi:hypothetical protein